MLETKQKHLKELVLYEKWRVQEQKNTDKLQRDAERLAQQNTTLKSQHESLEKEKEIEAEKLNQARFTNVAFTDWLFTNNAFGVRRDYTDDSGFIIENLKKQIEDIKSTNYALKESIYKLQKELGNLQTPGNEIGLEDLKTMIVSIRERNNKLELQNKALESNNTWYENRNKKLQSDIDSYRKNTNVWEAKNKTLQQEKDLKTQARSQPRNTEPRRYEVPQDPRDKKESGNAMFEQKTPAELKTEKENAKMRQLIEKAEDNNPHPGFNPRTQYDRYIWTNWASQTLGNPKLIEKDVIKAYHKLAKVFHPGIVQGKYGHGTEIDLRSDEIFKRIGTAKNWLLHVISGEPWQGATFSQFGVSSFTTSGLSGVAEKHARNRYTVKEENSHLGASSKFTPYKNT